jgi:hypothetical protein
MKDLYQELIEALGERFKSFPGPQVFFDECYPRAEAVSIEDDTLLISHVRREFTSMRFDGLVDFFTNEIKNDIQALAQQSIMVEKIVLIFKNTPSVKSKNVIGYVKVVRKKMP